MEQRINALEKGQKVFAALRPVGAHLAKSTIEKSLQNLIYFRVSQINGCAFCLDMHSKDLRAEGESEQRLYMISAWREVDLYTNRERAAFAWAEAVTTLTDGHVPDAVFEQAIEEFTEEELIDLTLGITTINTYNRFNVAFRQPAGDYQPGQFAAVN
jgi:AhpD family alkylhydroperoxidase